MMKKNDNMKGMNPAPGMGTRASEKELMKTSAGKISGTSGTDAHMGRAVKHLNEQTGRTMKDKDCGY